MEGWEHRFCKHLKSLSQSEPGGRIPFIIPLSFINSNNHINRAPYFFVFLIKF